MKDDIKQYLPLPVMGVLSPVSCNHLVLPVITEKGEVDLKHVRAGFNNLKDTMSLFYLVLPKQNIDFQTHLYEFSDFFINLNFL